MCCGCATASGNVHDGKASLGFLRELWRQLAGCSMPRSRSALSHPFIERLVSTVRQSFWIQSLFGAPEISNGSCCTSGPTTTEIEFMRRWAAHAACKAADIRRRVISLSEYHWQSHCRGLYQLPVAA